MRICGRIWVKEKDKNFLGQGKIELLEKIVQCGSIAQAAKDMKMSYKAAWDSIDAMNKLSNKPLVERITGGKGGGGTRITPQGLAVINTFHAMQNVQNKLLSLFENKLATTKLGFDFSKHLDPFMLKISAKNQFFATISAIEFHKIYSKITLKCNDSLEIFSIITTSSAKELGLKVGLEVVGIIKANWIKIADAKIQDCADNFLDLYNVLNGKIISVKQDENFYFLEIKNGNACFFLTHKKGDMDFKIGQKICFAFRAIDVILGV